MVEIGGVGLRNHHVDESRSHLADNPDSLPILLDETRRRDEIVGHTSVGPHRDDIESGCQDGRGLCR